MIIVEGTIKVRNLNAAKKHMRDMICASRDEDGCIDYAYAADLIDPSLIRVIERWESREALNRHLQSDHIAKWREVWPQIGIFDRSLRLYEAEPEPELF